LPQGQDPDKVIKEDPGLWAKLVESALPIVEYYFKIITSELDLDSPKGKAEAVRRLMPIIQEIGNAVERTHYVQKLARLVRVDERTLLDQAGVKSKRAKRHHEEEVVAPPDMEKFTFGPEEYCLSTLLQRPHLLQSLDDALRDVGVDGLSADDFSQPENRAIFASWQESLGTAESGGFREELDPALCPRFDLLLEGPKGAPPLNDDQAEKALIEGTLRLRQRRLQRLVEELRFLQADAGELGGAAIEEYGQMMNFYLSAKWRIDQALHANSFFGRSEANLRRTPGLVA
jgi:DNA primase